MQERRRLPDGFLLMLLPSSFCGGFLFISARRRTRSGGPRPARTGAERRHQTFEPRIGLENKKEQCFMHHSFLFVSARRGSNYIAVRKPSKYKEESTLPNRWVQTGCNHILIILIPTHYIALFIFFVL